jgi:L-threonylcarbamoyladenylate synthase
MYNGKMIIGQDARDAVATAVGALERGGVIAYPTETFYGLGVRYDDAAALQRLYALKRRPQEMALPLIIGSPELLPLLTDCVSDTAARLMRLFWPGPLTILFPARSTLSEYIVAGGTVAVRMPGESFALALARAASFPFTATSANTSGAPPARTAAEVLETFGEQLDLIVDINETKGGLPSTIVDPAGAVIKVVREGALPLQALMASGFPLELPS